MRRPALPLLISLAAVAAVAPAAHARVLLIAAGDAN
ncbi:MAG: hypothetical protein JWQ20_482, partial [Conexibacter sp.]|nr:hypothetical protein [Conexibacter sp.]